MKVLTICKLIKNVSRIDLSLILSYLIINHCESFISKFHVLWLPFLASVQTEWVTGTVKNKYHSGNFKFAYMLTSVICKA